MGEGLTVLPVPFSARTGFQERTGIFYKMKYQDMATYAQIGRGNREDR